MDLQNTEFQKLIHEVRRCRACIRMNDSERIFGAGSGRIDAPIMFIGEAPGRLGADASAIPFHGDKAGDNFERLLSHVGLTRYDIFVTNAVLCNPKDMNGNNATPVIGEVHNCSRFLRAQISLVDPRLIVTLGAKALSALSLIESHTIQLSTGLRRKWRWAGRTLVPLYHPGQRAMIHRSFLNQLGDYQFVAETWRRMNKARPRATQDRPMKESVGEIVKCILQGSGRISYFALHKIFYMIEYEHVRATGKRISDAYIVRQKDGPYVTDLHLRRLKLSLPGLRVWRERDTLHLELGRGEADLFSEPALATSPTLRTFIVSTSNSLAKYADSELKRRAYLTAPMREILRREKYGREHMYNSPLDLSLAREA